MVATLNNKNTLMEIYNESTTTIDLLTDQFPPVLLCPFDSPYLEEFEKVQNNMEETRGLYVMSLLHASPNDPMDDYIRQRYSKIIMGLVELDKNGLLYSDTPCLDEAIQRLRSRLDQL